MYHLMIFRKTLYYSSNRITPIVLMYILWRTVPRMHTSLRQQQKEKIVPETHDTCVLQINTCQIWLNSARTDQYLFLKMVLNIFYYFSLYGDAISNLTTLKIIYIYIYKTRLIGHCVRLEGTGDLNHYRCEDKFQRGCPTEPYTDEEIYKC